MASSEGWSPLVNLQRLLPTSRPNKLTVIKTPFGGLPWWSSFKPLRFHCSRAWVRSLIRELSSRIKKKRLPSVLITAAISSTSFSMEIQLELSGSAFSIPSVNRIKSAPSSRLICCQTNDAPRHKETQGMCNSLLTDSELFSYYTRRQ